MGELSFLSADGGAGDDWVWEAVRNDVRQFARSVELNREEAQPLIERHQRFTEEEGVLLDGNQWVLVK